MLMVWLVGLGFDRLLARDGVTRTDILLTSNLLTGIVAGFLFFSLTNNERLRRNTMRERLRTIAEMNHHIRNSLQVITYATATQKSNESGVDDPQLGGANRMGAARSAARACRGPRSSGRAQRSARRLEESPLAAHAVHLSLAPHS